MRARLVLRESGESLREGYGFENQREDGFGFAGQHGIEIIKVHELVESATKWKREKLEDIIDEAIRERKKYLGSSGRGWTGQQGSSWRVATMLTSSFRQD